MKYAELPGGEKLEFPDGTSDRIIQRTVRKQLNISELDIVAQKLDDLKIQIAKGQQESAQILTTKLDPLPGALKILNTTMKELSNTLDLQSFQTGQLTKIFKSIETANEKT